MPGQRKQGKIPLTVEQWLKAVNLDPNISRDVKEGRKPLHVAHTSYEPGSKVRQTEFLHLRSIWNIHDQSVDDFDKLLRDNPETRYKGYVSDENLTLAAVICQNPTEFLKRYYNELRGDGNGLTPNPKCGIWAAVRLWQALTTLHHKPQDKGGAASEGDSDEDSDDGSYDDSDEKTDGGPDARIVKKGYLYKSSTSPAMGALTKNFANAKLSTPTRRPPAVHGTPSATNYGMATNLKQNPQSIDEIYVNMSLILLLQAAGSESVANLGSLIWVPPRLPLHVRARVDPSSSCTHELLEAQVDGYLCRLDRYNQFSEVPLALCETKRFVRSKNCARTYRQETAEMAAWIASHWQSSEGLLQQSTSGRKRRLLISQDRHEIYIIIGEYGTAYEQYIIGNTALLGCAETVSFGSHFNADANKLSSIGSAAHLRQAQATGLTVPGLVQDGAATRKSPREKRLPPVDQFLVMHQFGPYIIHEADNMQRFIRRLIALMLQLRAGDVRYIEQRAPTEFLEQPTARSWPARQPTRMEEFENYAQ